jgi:hypothetical protein
MLSLDVQGQIFKTDYDTIIKIPYFRDMFKDCGIPTETIFVNRPSHIFKHVISLVTDTLYPYPDKYKFELEFYGVDYKDVKFYNPLPILKCIVDKCMRESIDRTQLCVIHSSCFVYGCRNKQTEFKGIKLKFCVDHVRIHGCGMFNCSNGNKKTFDTDICYECRSINKL